MGATLNIRNKPTVAITTNNNNNGTLLMRHRSSSSSSKESINLTYKRALLTNAFLETIRRCLDNPKACRSLLFAAITSNCLPAIRLLLKSQPNSSIVNAKDASNGRTALFYAVREGNVEAVKLLLEQGADVNVRDDAGQTALFYLPADNNQPDKMALARLLIERGCDVNAVTYATGRSALMRAAVMKNNFKTFQLLIDNGANFQAKDCNGKTAMAYADSVGNSEMVKAVLLAKMTT